MRNDQNVFRVIPIIHLDMFIPADVHQTFYNVNVLSYLFTNVTADTILKLQKEIGWYTKLLSDSKRATNMRLFLLSFIYFYI
jgi:hypothetical protein